MSYIAYFLADPETEDIKLIEGRARQQGMEVRGMEGAKIEAARKPCVHYRLGIGRCDYAIEAGSEKRAIEYADKLFNGLEDSACVLLRGFLVIK